MTILPKNFIPISQPSITDLEKEYVNKALNSGWISSLGEYIDLFEHNFANFCNTKYALTVCNGTTALHLALVAAGIKPGDEVIVPDLTFIATANAVIYANAVPKFADIEEDTLCLDPSGIESLITTKTKAIIPVHLYGHPSNMPAINEIGKKYNLIVIEDAAEAHGAQINGKTVGSWGDCGIFSFYGNKIITSGEGGMITTDNKEFYELAKRLRDHSMSKEKRYWHDIVGFNYRMTNLQAAFGCAQLERINELITRRNEIFNIYKERLNIIGSAIRLNYEALWAKNVYWMICLEVYGYEENQRNELMFRLKENGIDTRPYFYPVSDMPMYENANTSVAHTIYKRGINLPSYYDLTNEQVNYICDVLIQIFK